MYGELSSYNERFRPSSDVYLRRYGLRLSNDLSNHAFRAEFQTIVGGLASLKYLSAAHTHVHVRHSIFGYV